MEDGKLNLSIREKIPQQMDQDVEIIREAMRRYRGALPFTDKADPERIKEEFGMSKAAFKRAIGKMLKQGEIEISTQGIRLLG